MAASEKIKTIDNKIEQNKAQHDLDKILTVSSRYFSKYEFLTGKDFSPVINTKP